MKKVFLLLFLAVSFIACEGPTGPSGLDGRDGRDGINGKDGENGHTSNWVVKTFTVNEKDWKLSGKADDLGSFYYVDIYFKELTKSIFEKGGVIAYIESSKGIKNGLPYVWHRWKINNKEEILWTEKYDFDFYPEGISFYVTYSDFITQSAPGTETFHVVLMW